jgi:hypothetical protein
MVGDGEYPRRNFHFRTRPAPINLGNACPLFAFIQAKDRGAQSPEMLEGGACIVRLFLHARAGPFKGFHLSSSYESSDCHIDRLVLITPPSLTPLIRFLLSLSLLLGSRRFLYVRLLLSRAMRLSLASPLFRAPAVDILIVVD